MYVRGECVKFSPNIINRFIGIEVEGVVDLEVTDNQVSKDITTNHVKVWQKNGKISS